MARLSPIPEDEEVVFPVEVQVLLPEGMVPLNPFAGTADDKIEEQNLFEYDDQELMHCFVSA